MRRERGLPEPLSSTLSETFIELLPNTDLSGVRSSFRVPRERSRRNLRFDPHETTRPDSSPAGGRRSRSRGDDMRLLDLKSETMLTAMALACMLGMPQSDCSGPGCSGTGGVCPDGGCEQK